MNGSEDFELSRIRETRQQISEEFPHDPDLMAKHYMDLQKRHQDRLVCYSEAPVQEIVQQSSLTHSG